MKLFTVRFKRSGSKKAEVTWIEASSKAEAHDKFKNAYPSATVIEVG